MTETFTPEHFSVFNEETQRNNFPDAWALTCAQLGVTLAALNAAQPDVSFRKEDLVGYHQLQYDMQPDIIEATIVSAAAKDSHWKDWEPGQSLIRTLPKILSDKTTPAIMERVVLGNSHRTQEAKVLSPDLTDYLELRKDREARGYEVNSLYPTDGSRLVYNGRVTLNMGRVIIERIIGELKIFTDSLTIETDGEHYGLIVVSKQGPTSDAHIKSLRMFYPSTSATN